MSERESRGAKAGRFVRAAGLAAGATARELNKSVQEAKAAEAAVAAARPVTPPPPAPKTGGPVGMLVFYGFLASLVAFLLVVLRVESLFGASTPRTVLRVVVCVVLFGEAYLLLANWRGANQRLGQRVLRRVWGPRGAVTRRERVFARALRDGLTLVGIVWLAGGVYEVLTAIFGSSQL